ncbi:MAG: hypothetical protein ACYTF1_09355 [Planctomycetota bacterium]|jgi:hypothetical protein
MNKKSSSETGETGAKGVDNGENPNKSSPVRIKTLRHMRKLLIKTAAAGATLSVAGSSGPCNIVCDPLPPPVDCTTDLTSNYLDFWISQSARWVQSDSGLAIEISLSIAQLADPSSLLFTGDPVLEGATLVESNNGGTSLTFTCVPDQGATTVTVSAPISCSEVNDTFQLLLDISGTPQADSIIPASVGE